MQFFDDDEKIKAGMKAVFRLVRPSAEFKERALAKLLAKTKEQNSDIAARHYKMRVLPALVAAVIVVVIAVVVSLNVINRAPEPPQVQVNRPPVATTTSSPSGQGTTTASPVQSSATSTVSTATTTISPSATATSPAPSGTSPALPGESSTTVSPATTSPAPPVSSTTTPPVYAAATGLLKIMVTDAPPAKEVTGINVTVDSVSVQNPDTTAAGEDTWLKTDMAQTAPFDLLQLQGKQDLLASADLSAGSYSQIRLLIAAVNVAYGDGTTQAAGVPSGIVKLVETFNIAAGKTTVLVFDFDALQSLVFTGQGKVTFKPVIKITVSDPS